MNSPKTGQITQILSQVGNREAWHADDLMPLVYEEMRAMARRFLLRERRDHTLQPTAVVHEAYLQLVDQDRVEWRGRSHFLSVAATCMRRILVNHAKSKSSSKRGGKVAKLPLCEEQLESDCSSIDLIALDESITRLAEIDSIQAQIVEFRFFAGLTVEETARALGLSSRTIHREWAMAKAWLHGELQNSD